MAPQHGSCPHARQTPLTDLATLRSWGKDRVVACLDPDRPPNDVPRHRWRQFVGDCKNFLSSSETWANRATRLGWDAMALFGCAPKRPLDYLGSAGPSTAAGFLSCIAIGQGSTFQCMDPSAPFTVETSMRPKSLCPGPSRLAR